MKGIINIIAILGLAFFAAGCAKEEASEFNAIANILARTWYQPDSCSLLIDHTYSHLICDDACNGSRLGITGNSYHIKTYRANTGHSF